jgi:hypothetical protein
MSRYYYRRHSLAGDLLLVPFVVGGGIGTAIGALFGIGVGISEKQYNERTPVSNYKPTDKPNRLSRRTSEYIEATVASIPAGQRQRERINMGRYYSQFNPHVQIDMIKDKVFDAPVVADVPRISTRLRNEFVDAIKYGNPLRDDVQTMINILVRELDDPAASVKRMELVIEYSRLNDEQQKAKVLELFHPSDEPRNEVSDSPVGERKYSTFI